MFILDCSITMAWLFEDEKTRYTEEILKQLTEQAKAIVPPLWYLEVNNVLLVAERRGRVTVAQTQHFWTVLHQLPIVMQNPQANYDTNSILNLGRQYQLSAYDATYLDLAIKLNLPLASLDKTLLKAAQEAGVAVYSK
jgi:predicted nucleic acid-binding protein